MHLHKQHKRFWHLHKIQLLKQERCAVVPDNTCVACRDLDTRIADHEAEYKRLTQELANGNTDTRSNDEAARRVDLRETKSYDEDALRKLQSTSSSLRSRERAGAGRR